MDPTTITSEPCGFRGFSSGARPDFPATHWSVVLAAGALGEAKAHKALANLCQEYWYPLYAHVRRRGHDAHDAQDLTQEFFARLLENNFLKTADKKRGRFRSFLIGALNNFLNNEWKRSRTIKRGGACKIISCDAQTAEERYCLEPFHDLTADKLYERRWALSLLERAMEELREEYSASGKEQLFDQLQVALSGTKGTESYVQIARKLNMSEGAVNVAVYRLRQRYGKLLRARIAQTVGNESDIDDELRHLFASIE